MKIRALIIDDEPLGRSLIRKLLADQPDFENIGEIGDGHEALLAIQRESPDLVFLDVQMPGLSGFEVLASLQPDEVPPTIFVTAFDGFALEAFEAHALDYLLKPIAEDRFIEALQRVKTFITGNERIAFGDRIAGLKRELAEVNKHRTRIAVECGGRFVFLKTTEIDWIGADGNYLNLHVGRQNFLLRGRISELERDLSPEHFLRIHRSTIVNLDRVKEFQPLFKGEGLMVLKDGSELAVSRGYHQKLREILRAKL